MAKSLLSTFVTSTRALLIAQLIACVGAVALAGWTLGVTNQVLRERNRLQERVIQLEEAMAAGGVIPPPPTAVIAAPGQSGDVYPGSVSDTVAQMRASLGDGQRDIGSVITNLFGPAPPIRIAVIHVRSQADVATATRLGSALAVDAVMVRVMTASDQRPSGYVYFDGRQSRDAAEAVARLHEAAREENIAQWSAQLRGTALPARDEYTADRLDIILPPLPPPPAPPEPQPDPAATVTSTPQP